MNKSMETVRRRRDWVTLLGMIFFLAIVAAEIGVAVGVPLWVRREGVMAENVLRLDAIEQFDFLRRRISNNLSSVKTDLGRYEASLMYSTLNHFANYMHEYVEDMSIRQFQQVHQRVIQLGAVAGAHERKRVYAERREIDFSGVLAALAAPPVPASAEAAP